MKNLSALLAAAALAGCAAPSQPTPTAVRAAPAPQTLAAPTVGTVFGLTFGAPLGLQECPKGRLLGELEYKPANVPCVRAWRPAAHALDLRAASTVTVVFPAGQRLALFAAPRVGAFLIDGNLHVVTIQTGGYDVQNLVHEQLVEKYGKPRRYARNILSSGSGTLEGGIQAEWAVSGLEVSFIGVLGSVRTGVVTIGTPEGLRASSEGLRRAIDAGRRPL